MKALILGLFLAIGVYSSEGQAADAKSIVAVINREYGAVCNASLEGWFSSTLKIDWTARTNKLHAIKVFSEIAGVKEALYRDGVRYLKFPNDAGTYNIVDWKTGEKSSVNDRAPYFF